jgi:hypothetical protein
MHEVITLQFGQQANHVGTHFWNAQVSLNFHTVSQPLRNMRLVIHKDNEVELNIDNSLYYAPSHVLAEQSFTLYKNKKLTNLRLGSIFLVWRRGRISRGS